MIKPDVKFSLRVLKEQKWESDVTFQGEAMNNNTTYYSSAKASHIHVLIFSISN